MTIEQYNDLADKRFFNKFQGGIHSSLDYKHFTKHKISYNDICNILLCDLDYVDYNNCEIIFLQNSLCAGGSHFLIQKANSSPIGYITYFMDVFQHLNTLGIKYKNNKELVDYRNHMNERIDRIVIKDGLLTVYKDNFIPITKRNIFVAGAVVAKIKNYI